MFPPSRAGKPLFLEAIALMRQGQFDAAEAAFLRLLKREPRNADACHLAGFAAAELGRLEDAVSLLRRAVAIHPRNPIFQFDLGKTLLQLDRYEDGLVNLNRAVALDGKYAEAHYHRGLALAKLKRRDEALAAFERTISLQPDFADAHNELGCALSAGRNFAQALTAFRKALSLQPDSVAYLTNTAQTLCNTKGHAEALPLVEKILAVKPGDQATLCLHAEVLLGLGRLQEALAVLEAILAQDPRHLRALIWYTTTLLRLGQTNQALLAAKEAHAVAPDDAMANYNLGYALSHNLQFDDALNSCEEAIRLDPDKPNFAWARALYLLTLGRFADGWAGYETRNRMPDIFTKRNYTQPLWLGQQSLKGQRLYVYWEQGFGDTIQFARYVLLATAAGAEVFFSVQDALRRLFGDWFHTVRVIGHNEAPSAFHFHCPLLSMPLAFGTSLETIPSLPDGYLKVPAQNTTAWQEKLPQKRRRIGVVWSGSPIHPNDEIRSLPLAQLQSLVQPDDAWVSLQKDVKESDRPMLQAFGFLDPSAELKDFADTAALISALDLVIAVDTSVAHLAGALGKPCWVMLPYSPDFRWLLDREDSPWYPGMRLFRQQRPGDWGSVVSQIKAALQTRAQVT